MIIIIFPNYQNMKSSNEPPREGSLFKTRYEREGLILGGLIQKLIFFLRGVLGSQDIINNKIFWPVEVLDSAAI